MTLKTHLGLILTLCLLAAACQTTKRVVLLVDGQRRVVETRAATVSAVLDAEKIKLGENDRVEPPGYTPIERTATIQITRVELQTEKKRVPIEFARKLTRDETLPDGKMRVVQLGENGEAEVAYQITYENGAEVSRREISRVVLKPPRDEILTLGTQNALAPVEIRGTLVYLAHGNAWVLRNSSNDKRPLTFEGDLDGRVFDLSPDGKYLLFTRAGGTNSPSPLLNSLWLADTVILDEKPRRVPRDDLLYAQWAPDGSNQIAYSTGEKTAGAPGWKARNDLYLATLSGIYEAVTLNTASQPITAAPRITTTAPLTATPTLTATQTTSITVTAKTPISLTTRQVLASSVPAPYAWWGGSWAWAPDTRAFAYALPDQVGIVNVSTGTRRALRQFAFYNTRADWVWLPQVAWSPDSRFIAATVHAPPEGAGLSEDSPAFDVWLLARDNTANVPLARDAGMWAFPTWSPRDAQGESRLAFGVAQNAFNSERARYALYIMDRDGSNRARILPEGASSKQEGLRVIQVAWAPDVTQLVAVRDGDLWLYDLAKQVWWQLTANGDAKLPRWR